MFGFRIIRYVQQGKVAYSPQIFTNLKIVCVSHPTQYDESDDIEYQKTYIKETPEKLHVFRPEYRARWGESTIKDDMSHCDKR
jgi:hypothetical protein